MTSSWWEEVGTVVLVRWCGRPARLVSSVVVGTVVLSAGTIAFGAGNAYALSGLIPGALEVPDYVPASLSATSGYGSFPAGVTFAPEAAGAGVALTAVAVPLAVAGAGLAGGYAIGTGLRKLFGGSDPAPNADVPAAPPVGAGSPRWANDPRMPLRFAQPFAYGTAYGGPLTGVMTLGEPVVTSTYQDVPYAVDRPSPSTGALGFNYEADVYCDGALYGGVSVSGNTLDFPPNSSAASGVMHLVACPSPSQVPGIQVRPLLTPDSTGPAGSDGARNIGRVPNGPQAVVVPDAPDPVRTITSTSTCTDGAGHTSTAVATVTFRDSVVAADPSAFPSIVAPACPEGLGRSGLKVVETSPLTQPKTYTDTSTYPTVDPQLYPACVRPGSCVMTLVAVFPDGTRVNCTNTIVCAGRPTDEGQSYECKWGPYPRALADCDGVKTEPRADEGGQTDEDGLPTAAQIPSGDTNCRPHGWGIIFNPLGWIYKPVKCALIWAFVPPPGYLGDKAGGVKTAFDASALGTVSGTIATVGGGLTSAPPATSDCHGPGVPLSVVFHRDNAPVLYAFDACDGVGLYLSTFLRPIVVALLWVPALLLSLSIVAAAFGLQLPWQGGSEGAEEMSMR